MQKSPIHYYYKDPETGVEMNFSNNGGFGWGVSFPNAKTQEEIRTAILYKNIPWPALSTEEQVVVDENYKKLHKMMEEDDEQDNQYRDSTIKCQSKASIHNLCECSYGCNQGLCSRVS